MIAFLLEKFVVHNDKDICCYVPLRAIHKLYALASWFKIDCYAIGLLRADVWLMTEYCCPAEEFC
jgi:hypothetical protein